MANGNGNGNAKLTMVVSSGALLAVATIIINLIMSVQKDAAIALDVTKQHGAEFVAVRQELALLRDSMRDQTQDRYKGKDAARDIGYLERRLAQLEKDIARLEKFHK